jgi:hypothetical protein
MPLSLLIGAVPINAEACLLVIYPSSGMSLKRLNATTLPTPRDGIQDRRSLKYSNSVFDPLTTMFVFFTTGFIDVT